MNREFKFRVWETNTKKMTYLGNLLCWEHGYCSESFTTFNTRISDLHVDIFSLDNNVWRENSKKRFILQQFTGLKDKNGREIYDGDIIIFNKCNSAFDNLKFEIKFGSYTCPFSEGYIEDIEYGYFAESTKLGYIKSIALSEKIEIIGNIFENSDLLK